MAVADGAAHASKPYPWLTPACQQRLGRRAQEHAGGRHQQTSDDRQHERRDACLIGPPPLSAHAELSGGPEPTVRSQRAALDLCAGSAYGWARSSAHQVARNLRWRVGSGLELRRDREALQAASPGLASGGAGGRYTSGSVGQPATWDRPASSQMAQYGHRPVGASDQWMRTFINSKDGGRTLSHATIHLTPARRASGPRGASREGSDRHSIRDTGEAKRKCQGSVRI
jgi:hypothetical protein